MNTSRGISTRCISALATAALLFALARPGAAGDLVPFNPHRGLGGRADETNAVLLSHCYASVCDWALVMDSSFVPWPGLDGSGFYGGKTSKPEDIVPVGRAVFINAFIASAVTPNMPTYLNREGAEYRAKAALRFLCATHQTGKLKCPDGRRWGNAKEYAAGVRAMALGAWLIWKDLYGDLRGGVLRVLAREAGLLAKQPIETGGAQAALHNAAAAQVLSLASLMLPSHSDSAEWDRAAKARLYNTFSTEEDKRDKSDGGGGKTVAQWVVGANASPDHTLNADGVLDVSAMTDAAAMTAETALNFLLFERPAPKAALHNFRQTCAVLKRIAGWDGAPIHFLPGEDELHTQAADVFSHAFASVIFADGQAACLEHTALEYILQTQREFGGGYAAGREIGYGNRCAVRVVETCLLHAMKGPGKAPLPLEEFHRAISGVTDFKFSGVLVHRRPDSFCSFAWRPGRSAMTLPVNGSWVIWPHPASYVGTIEGEPPTGEKSKLVKIVKDVRPDGFSVTCRLLRLGGKVEHDISFSSLDGGVAVFLDLRVAREDVEVSDQKIGIIGIEYPLGVNQRSIYIKDEKLVMEGLSAGKDERYTFFSPWLNIENKMGYAVYELTGSARNKIFYFNQGGVRPRLREWLALHYRSDSRKYRKGDIIGAVCIVSFPNQRAAYTQRAFELTGAGISQERTVYCITGRHIVAANFGDGVSHYSPDSFSTLAVPGFSTVVREAGR